MALIIFHIFAQTYFMMKLVDYKLEAHLML